MIKNVSSVLLTIVLTIFLYNGFAAAHCEVPCGIYDDKMRLEMIDEHITTVEKAMNQIKTLSGEPAKNSNQLVRWISNKEQHATEIQHIISQYFMTQRIKFDTDQYDAKLAALHQMLVYAMKCKQGIDTANVEKLRKATREFENLYLTMQ